MDYIREELLRQRAALARLLLGGSGMQEEQTEEKQDTEDAAWGECAGDAGEALFWSSRQATEWQEEAELPWTVGMAEPEHRDFRWALPEQWTETAVGYRSERAWAEEKILRPDGRTVLRSRRVTGSGGEVQEEETIPMVVTAPARAGAEAERAKELSRVFQRDARRYDGGFTLY